jgi:hypothetical protein
MMGLSVAILDHALSDGECTNLCARLNERNIPFLMYTGMEKATEGPCKDAPYLAKSSSHAALLDAMEDLIRGHNRRATGTSESTMGGA